MADKKRERGNNFTESEKALLAQLVEPHLTMLNAKFTSKNDKNDKKKIWESIAASLNARGGAQRTGQQLKEKWRKSTSEAKQAVSKERQHARQTGGGPPPKPIDPVVQKIISLNQDAPNFHGIVGGGELGVIPGFNLIPDDFDDICPTDKDTTILLKAMEIKSEIHDFLKNYKPTRALPKIGESIFNCYEDVTRHISDGQRDTLTHFLCSNFKELNLSVKDLPSMIHDTISYIVSRLDMKENQPCELVVLNPPCDCPPSVSADSIVHSVSVLPSVPSSAPLPPSVPVTTMTVAPSNATVLATIDINSATSEAMNKKKAPKGKPKKQESFQQLQMSVLRWERPRAKEARRKFIKEREKIELEKELLHLQIKKIKRELNEQ